MERISINKNLGHMFEGNNIKRKLTEQQQKQTNKSNKKLMHHIENDALSKVTGSCVSLE